MAQRFSNRQLVTMVVAVCVAVVLAPTTVWAAATATSVRITDGGGVVAHVDAAGRLSVGDGKGPLTVDGTVKAAQPGKPFYYHAALTTAGGRGVVFDGGKGKSLYITSWSVQVQTNDQTSVTRLAQLDVMTNPPSGDCSNPIGATLERVIPLEVSTEQTAQLTYPTMALPFTTSKKQMCVLADFPVFNDTGKTYTFDIVGYTTG